jgi:hypothetical protein
MGLMAARSGPRPFRSYSCDAEKSYLEELEIRLGASLDSFNKTIPSNVDKGGIQVPGSSVLLVPPPLLAHRRE